MIVPDNGKALSHNHHYGGSLENIKLRLDYYYSSVSVKIEKAEDGGTRVDIRISGKKPLLTL